MKKQTTAQKNRAKGLCACGGVTVSKRKARCQKCIDSHKRYRDALREEMLIAYGHKCQCPGGCNITEEEFLCLDHIFDDGHEHRKRVGKTHGTYRFLKKNGWPKDRYRLLCHNCNQSKQFYGECPHLRQNLIN